MWRTSPLLWCTCWAADQESTTYDDWVCDSYVMWQANDGEGRSAGPYARTLWCTWHLHTPTTNHCGLSWLITAGHSCLNCRVSLTRPALGLCTARCTMILQPGKLLGPWPMLCKTSRRRSETLQQFPSHSTVLHQHRWCARFHQASGDRPCRCRCRYCVSPLSMSHQITHSRSRLRPNCTHRLPGPGHRPPCFVLADFDSECSRAAMSAPRCPTLRRWYQCTQKRAGLCHTVPSFYRCGPGGCRVTGARHCCRGFGYVYYYELVLATQPTGVTGIYGSVDQVVVELPTSYDAPVVPLEISPVADHLATLNPQESQVSCLSPV